MSARKNINSSSTGTTAIPDSLEVSENVFRRVFRRYFPLIFILWILFVLYPNPLNLINSIHRALNFDADPGAVEFMLNDFPSAPADIEKAVLARGGLQSPSSGLSFCVGSEKYSLSSSFISHAYMGGL